MSDTTQKSGLHGAGDDEYTPTGTDQVAENLAALDDDEAELRAATLRAGLEDYELDEEDAALLSGEYGDEGDEGPLKLDPVLAIIGRPQRGQVHLGQPHPRPPRSCCGGHPGRYPRPRHVLGALERPQLHLGGYRWLGARRKGIHARVAEQAEMAVELADAVLFVVDSAVGATATDEGVMKMLRKSKKPVIMVANKVDDFAQEADSAALWGGLGFGQPYPVSALHGRGVADLLDHVMDTLPEYSLVDGVERSGGPPRRIALIGRPNVGKSSLLNKLAGSERVVVDPLAGTTRDPVDEFIELGDRTWRFVDTAGIRRRQHMAQGADFYASLRTQAALEKAEVASCFLPSTRSSASRTSVSCSWPLSPAVRWCSRSTSGTSWTTNAAVTLSVKSSRTWPTWSGHPPA